MCMSSLCWSRWIVNEDTDRAQKDRGKENEGFKAEVGSITREKPNNGYHIKAQK